LQDVISLVEHLIKLDEDVIRAGYKLEDDWDPLDEAWDLFLSAREASGNYTPMTLSIASVDAQHLDDEVRQQMLEALVPRRLFRITHHHAKDGGAHVALVGGRTPFLPTEPRTRWDVAPLDGVLKVVAIWSLCPQCFGTGVRNGGSCDYQDLSGNPCESGFVFQGGIRLDLGEALETVRFDPPPEHERYHPVYYA
jgi:hypothetical protein